MNINICLKPFHCFSEYYSHIAYIIILNITPLIFYIIQFPLQKQMKTWLKFGFTIIKITSRELETQLAKYKLWTIPFEAYSKIKFTNPQVSFLSQIIDSRKHPKDHDNLKDKAGLYLLSKNATELSEQQLMVFANIHFQEGKNPLTASNIQHIIRVSMSRQNISLVTKLLLCLKSNDKMMNAQRAIEQFGLNKVAQLDESEIINVLILLQKCYSSLEVESQDIKLSLPQNFNNFIEQLNGASKIVGQAMLHSLGLLNVVDSTNVYKVLQNNKNLSLEVIYGIFLIKSRLMLDDKQTNELFRQLYRHIQNTTIQNSWMIVSIFSKLSTVEKLIVIDKLKINCFHHEDYILFLEILETSQLQVRIKGNHLFPYWIKDVVNSEQFERILVLRYQIKYDNQQSFIQILNSTFSRSLVCFKGLLKFISTLPLENQAILEKISKLIIDIVKNNKAKNNNVKNYDIVQLYNSIGLLAKHQLCKNKFWRQIQNHLIIYLEEAIQQSNYLSTVQKEQFVANMVLLLKNHYGKSKMEQIVLNQLKLSLNGLWSIQGLSQLVANLGVVGIGQTQIWCLIQQNLEMMRKDMQTQSKIVNILKVMLRMDKGSGYYWIRVAESLPSAMLEQLKAESFILERKVISNYLVQGSSKKQGMGSR